MDILSIFLVVATAHFLALLSPGPDFVLVVKSALKNGSKKSTGVAAGISCANAIYIALCIIGVGSVLASSVKLMFALKIIGGIFLIYLAIQALRAKKNDYKTLEISATSNGPSTTWIHEFLTGFMSGILNPKSILFYLSLFTVVLTQDVSMTVKIALGVWMTCVVFLWDVIIILLLSTQKVRQRFSRMSYYIDKLSGAILGLLGLTIVRSALVR